MLLEPRLTQVEVLLEPLRAEAAVLPEVLLELSRAQAEIERAVAARTIEDVRLVNAGAGEVKAKLAGDRPNGRLLLAL